MLQTGIGSNSRADSAFRLRGLKADVAPQAGRAIVSAHKRKAKRCSTPRRQDLRRNIILVNRRALYYVWQDLDIDTVPSRPLYASPSVTANLHRVSILRA